jgi:hypothetical protein
MSAARHSSLHEEIWLLLPWLANGRLSGEQRERAEEHVRLCGQCANELAAQGRLCDALSAPETVTYAPGPSFRKLLERIDGPSAQATRADSTRGESNRAGTPSRVAAFVARNRGKLRGGSAGLWRPPGLAWAASFIIMVAMTGLVTIAYRWSESRFRTVTDMTDTRPPVVVQVAFDRRLTIGEVEELLRADGAHVVEGSGTTGVFDIAPVTHAGERPATAEHRLQDLAARLRTDPRVLWVQPIGIDDAVPEKSPTRGP